MRFCVLASGSKGNCTFIEIDNHKYLIDIGMNFLYVCTKLKEIGIEPCEIEGIFITHIHEDHILGLKKFIKTYTPTVYLTEKIYSNIGIEIQNYHFIDEDDIIEGNLIETIKLSHDTPECKGYIFNSKNASLVYITDTGYINQKYFTKLSNKTAYILESNHDIDMIMNGNRPHFLKMRVIGDEGHISNKDCLYYLTKFVGNETKYILLAHISHDNNDPKLVLDNIKNNIKVENIMITNQNDRTEVIEI